MQKFICLQAGHENTTSGATGAPGEVEFNIRIRNRLGELLIQNGFMVQLVDAKFNTNPERVKDFDLFLAIHYDADIYGTGGGFVDYPEPSTDFATIESQRIHQCIEDEYFNYTGIVNHPERSNKNTRYYYMWSALSAKTPCVIIECGVGKDAHDNVILNDTDRVANGILKGIKKAFPDTVTPPTEPPITDPCLSVKEELELLKKQLIKKDLTIDGLEKEVNTMEKRYELLQNEMETRLAKKDLDCEDKIKDFTTRLTKDFELKELDFKKTISNLETELKERPTIIKEPKRPKTLKGKFEAMLDIWF